MTPQYHQLLNSVLKFLSIRPRSRREIEIYLTKKTSDTALINQVIDKLTNFKLIDDAAFSKWLVESRSRSRPRGRRLLIQELKTKGVDISNLPSPVSSLDETELAKNALQKKLKIWDRLPRRDFRLKTTRFLYSRGFSWDVIEKVLKNVYNKNNVN
ncbi:hypothetical protein A3H89_04860 [Candidatus Amesbacteria bacterium RIFCSPLOWO2_02_FULL_48_11]|uniref:Regulatory protein RecX n=4 Tax=Candidatus Amesiibacteriota TaxID=1752730 RepID=A0A1F4ZCW3_9BACT|nr:MAG: Regulatory protein RecX [Candidatus Amesbacteria bacterium GW2011_GWA2_47_11]KKW00093.1 MAG: Regulatory protein RecX [Candidatus Amesbacteria bacterium GW2011_GWA1_48_9]OGC90182.1 MAG: hypothetical protein A2V48_01465 [Candidatus Amesbacteria bacterium RBG_19FT_COMBO_48_16]OGC95866.1 MAG: hypothetical protein A3C34_04025 [Candidatus Amesbacteria bacterium RIFCSPHIGHO2_02_FULL_48_21]OGC99620.1 MAG: hypothetical protein A2702_02045 [Candidatus Amesbacteria bacterium RIFCSPHIGHO2_01_FULL_4